jgi:hypothetical protein
VLRPGVGSGADVDSGPGSVQAPASAQASDGTLYGGYVHSGTSEYSGFLATHSRRNGQSTA